MGEAPAAESLGEARAVRHLDLEAAPARADQVMADVRRPVANSLPLRGPAGALDGGQGDAHLRLAGRCSEILHGVPVAVAAGKVHPRVDPGRVPTQDLLDRADQLHEAAPVERRTEPQARHRVAGGDLVGGLALVLGANRILGGRPLRDQRLLHRSSEGGHAGVEFAHPLPELRHESARQRLGQRTGRVTVLDPRQRVVRREACRPPRQDSVGQEPQVLEEPELEHAGQRPQLADRQRRYGLKGENETGEPPRAEPAVTVPDQLERHRMDARLAREFAWREGRQRPIVTSGEVPSDGPRLRLDEVEVVEQPLGGRRHRDAPVDVVGEGAIGRGEDADVLIQPRQHVVPAGPRGRHQCEKGGERLGALLEALEAQQFTPERHGLVRTAPSEQGSPHRVVFNVSPTLLVVASANPCPAPGARLASVTAGIAGTVSIARYWSIPASISAGNRGACPTSRSW